MIGRQLGDHIGGDVGTVFLHRHQRAVEVEAHLFSQLLSPLDDGLRIGGVVRLHAVGNHLRLAARRAGVAVANGEIRLRGSSNSPVEQLGEWL